MLDAGTNPAILSIVFLLTREEGPAGPFAVRDAFAKGEPLQGWQVDDAARGVIERAGYGEYFIHRTGHGIVLETHELPNIMAGVVEPLEPGTTFTVEPGIYVPGKTGVRIEDNVVITTEGAHVLTGFPRELIVIPA